MDLFVREGVLSGSFQVETPAARAAVLSQVEQLKSALAEQGVEIGSSQVSVEGQDRPPGEAAGEREPRGSGGLSVGQEPEPVAVEASEVPADGIRTSYMDVRG